MCAIHSSHMGDLICSSEEWGKVEQKRSKGFTQEKPTPTSPDSLIKHTLPRRCLIPGLNILRVADFGRDCLEKIFFFFFVDRLHQRKRIESMCQMCLVALQTHGFYRWWCFGFSISSLRSEKISKNRRLIRGWLLSQCLYCQVTLKKK